jgi:sugar (pentulose or hexulose) kinase
LPSTAGARLAALLLPCVARPHVSLPPEPLITLAPQEDESRLIVPASLTQRPFSLNDDTEFDAEALMAVVIDVAVQSLQAAAHMRPDLHVGLVGVSVFAVTIICLDSELRPLWNASSYADKRTFSFAESARASMHADQVQQL